ncbi:hypothetical protein KR074_004852 [Drosophila pseudoananassae]|nr:hypothetical protein KR074_004852 [Drosophila pseudoananassae]
MIPQTENIDSIEETLLEECQFFEDCGESSCDRAETAMEVCHRILQRLSTHPQDYSTKMNESDFLKQIWIASFTGGPIQYRC